jgi:hypothetical protein
LQLHSPFSALKRCPSPKHSTHSDRSVNGWKLLLHLAVHPMFSSQYIKAFSTGSHKPSVKSNLPTPLQETQRLSNTLSGSQEQIPIVLVLKYFAKSSI